MRKCLLLLLWVMLIVSLTIPANAELQPGRVSKFPDGPPPVPPGFEQDLKYLSEVTVQPSPPILDQTQYCCTINK